MYKIRVFIKRKNTSNVATILLQYDSFRPPQSVARWTCSSRLCKRDIDDKPASLPPGPVVPATAVVVETWAMPDPVKGHLSSRVYD